METNNKDIEGKGEEVTTRQQGYEKKEEEKRGFLSLGKRWCETMITLREAPDLSWKSRAWGGKKGKIRRVPGS